MRESSPYHARCLFHSIRASNRDLCFSASSLWSAKISVSFFFYLVSSAGVGSAIELFFWTLASKSLRVFSIKKLLSEKKKSLAWINGWVILNQILKSTYHLVSWKRLFRLPFPCRWEHWKMLWMGLRIGFSWLGLLRGIPWAFSWKEDCTSWFLFLIINSESEIL